MSFIDDLITEVSAPPTVQHLELDSLVVIPRLMRRLPAVLAFRHHALPVAEATDRITVAMADPGDARARSEISAALGTRLYFVQANRSAIDRVLAEVWPEEIRDPLQLLVYHQDSPIVDTVQSYAQYLCNLLDGQISGFPMVASVDTTFKDLTQAACSYDLVIFGEPDQPFLERLFTGDAGLKAAEQMPSSVLIARRPRWPLKQILLVIRGHQTDDVAVDWTICLAQPSNAAVTVLAVESELPAMCDQVAHRRHRLANWLASDTPFGRQMCNLAQQLVNWETKGTIRFRQGSVDRQIQDELIEESYDLVIIAADPSNWWLRRLLGELVTPLLHWADLPVLITRGKMQ